MSRALLAAGVAVDDSPHAALVLSVKGLGLRAAVVPGARSVPDVPAVALLGDAVAVGASGHAASPSTAKPPVPAADSAADLQQLATKVLALVVRGLGPDPTAAAALIRFAVAASCVADSEGAVLAVVCQGVLQGPDTAAAAVQECVDVLARQLAVTRPPAAALTTRSRALEGDDAGDDADGGVDASDSNAKALLHRCSVVGATSDADAVAALLIGLPSPSCAGAAAAGTAAAGTSAASAAAQALADALGLPVEGLDLAVNSLGGHPGTGVPLALGAMFHMFVAGSAVVRLLPC